MDVPSRFGSDSVEIQSYKCPGCRAKNRFAILPSSPVIAKHRCPTCNRVNEVRTREDAFDALTTGGSFEDYVDDQKKKKEWERHPSASFDMGAKTEEVIAGGETLRIVDRRRVS